MATKIMTSDSTASGDTTKTLVDTLTVPMNVKKIVGISILSLGGAGITTLEDVTGIMTFESDDMDIAPMILPLPQVAVLTSGVAALNPFIWPVDIPVVGGAKIKGYVTMDMALTVDSKIRFTLIYE